MDKSIVKRYFEENAALWLSDGYKDNGYNYPVGYHRVRIVMKVLSEFKKPLRIVDLGCGGGNLVLTLANQGHTAIGIDQSTAMVIQAKKMLDVSPPEVQKFVDFICQPLEEINLEGNFFDAITSMGVIGYLPCDGILFNIANKLLKKGGVFLVSSRNRLFNMISISYRTVKEIESGNALELISEISELCKGISNEDTDALINKLKKNVEGLSNKHFCEKIDMLSNIENYEPKPYTMEIEPRQHTPKCLIEIANRFGFKHKAYYGVHPHLMMPRMNYLLPPQVFNKLSECLEVLEHLPISLTWSSVFIGVFEKTE